MRQVMPMCAESELLPEVRCPQCNRLLFKGRVIQVEIKCPKCHWCHTITTVDRCCCIGVGGGGLGKRGDKLATLKCD